jgi:hypothetical protein
MKMVKNQIKWSVLFLFFSGIEVNMMSTIAPMKCPNCGKVIIGTLFPYYGGFACRNCYEGGRL